MSHQPKQSPTGEDASAGAATANGAQDETTTALSSMTCRFYEKLYPEVDECVMVEIKSIEEMGVYVTLLEYGNMSVLFTLASRVCCPRS